MSKAGTFLLDGLLQGPSPGEDKLQRWIDEAAAAGLNFSLEVNGSQFSILADNRSNPTSKLNGVGLDIAMASLLESLLALYPAKRAALYSTLRSQEFRPTVEIQTIYLINPDGTVKTQSREIAVQAPPPPIPVSGRERTLRAAVIVFGILLILVGSNFFVNWRELFHKVRQAAQPTQGVELDASALSPYVNAKLTKVRQLDGYLEIELTHGPQWAAAKPEDLDEPVVAPGAPARSWKDFLAVQAVKRGLMRCCFYDEKGLPSGETQVSLEPLRMADVFVAQISVPHADLSLKKVVLRP